MHILFSPDSSFVFAQWAFIKLIAIVYFIAFWSLYVQIKGLYGSKGILPLKEVFDGIRKDKYYLHHYYTPSVFWWGRSDNVIQNTAIVGMLCSFIAFLGYLVPLMFIITCYLYRSYLSACIYFLSFQWDTLLIEVGFAAILFSLQTPPLPIAVFLMWVILFRFLFSSGFVKFFTGSQEWRDLTAMQYHYETQPLPNKISHYLHHLPNWFSKLTTIIVFLSELIVPFFIFINEEFRLAAFILIIGFQIAIAITGNFAFFNLLTIALAFSLFEDHFLPSTLYQYFNVPSPQYSIFISIIVSASCIILIVLNFFRIVQMFKPLPKVDRVLRIISPLYIVNHYGLFSHMTIDRCEIIIEGSDDKQTWKEYEFKWKPDDLKKPLKMVAPHQPRLDWQMWFAALGNARQNPWFGRFILRLLEGSPDVLKLLKTNPFPDAPPRYIRAKLYEYNFTSPEEKKETGKIWNREYIGIYYPITEI